MTETKAARIRSYAEGIADARKALLCDPEPSLLGDQVLLRADDRIRALMGERDESTAKIAYSPAFTQLADDEDLRRAAEIQRAWVRALATESALAAATKERDERIAELVELRRALVALRRAVGAYAAQHKADRCGCLVCDTTRLVMAQADAVLANTKEANDG
jgi:hypothetical protein